MRLAKGGHGGFDMDILQKEILNHPRSLAGPRNLQSLPIAVYLSPFPLQSCSLGCSVAPSTLFV